MVIEKKDEFATFVGYSSGNSMTTLYIPPDQSVPEK
jgi:hypothetical protein